VSKAKAIADLKRSGLTAADFKKLGIKVITAAENEKLTGHNVAGYLIPYLDVQGKPIKNGWRVRHLEEIKGFGGSTKSKQIRYTGPKGELPHLYFPPNFKNWPAQAKDVTEAIFITEGEKKAAAMCKRGYATIAVPGVWGWKSKAAGVDIIADFDWIEWGDPDNPRPVFMVFDNDVIIKEQVLAALNALSRRLVAKCAQVSIRHLPEGPLKGADDYLREHTDAEFDELETTAFEMSAELWAFSERCAFIDNQNFVYDLKTRRNYSSAQRLEFTFANDKMICFNAAGDEVLKKTCTQWLEWPHRRQYNDLVFAPGEGAVVDGSINTWPGWGCQPIEGDVKPYYKLLDFVFDGEPALKEYFLKWLAYPLQHPGTKMYQAFLFWSQVGGVGKSFLGLIMGRIYGETFSEVSKDELTSGFNQWRIDKQFILGDEITGGDSKREADKVKGLITADSFIANQKNQGTYPQRSCENYLLTSNHANAIYMTGQDRRFIVHHINRPPPPKKDKYFDPTNKWMREDGGARHLFWHLLNEIDLTGFNPREAAPETQAKLEMLEDSKSGVEMQLEDLVGNPEQYLRLGAMKYERDVYTVAELLDCMNIDGRFANMASRFFTSNRIPKNKVSNKKVSKRLVAIRNCEKWRKAEAIEWGDNYLLDFKPNKYTKEN
jgi:hypothetical protein